MSANLTILWESLDSLLDAGLEDMAVAHWEEAEGARPQIPLSLDFRRARQFEEAGQFKVASIRKGRELIGYAAFTIMPAFFYSSTLSAYCQAIYVVPEHRGFPPLALIAWCEHHLAQIGVREIHIASKNERQRDLFTKQGYVTTETMHSKVLGSNHVQRERRPPAVSTA